MRRSGEPRRDDEAQLVRGLWPRLGQASRAGYKPEERLAGLAPEDVLLALPTEVLRGLSDEHVRTLPEHVQRAIRAQLTSSK